jgi:hypothetical protein
MTKAQKQQNEIFYQHINQLGNTAKRLRGRRIRQGRSLNVGYSLKVARRYHQIYGFKAN